MLTYIIIKHYKEYKQMILKINLLNQKLSTNINKFNYWVKDNLVKRF